MAVKETGVSYYGIGHVEHARRDFEKMKDNHCTAVLLALTEFDLFFWEPNIPKIVDEAKNLGLSVYLNTWGIGKFFGGEAPSWFLQEHIHDRQVTALTGESVAAASPSSTAFREYFWGQIEKLARRCDADGFFWDEPHYAMPVYPVSYQSTTDWTDRSVHAMRRFKDHYGYEMPKVLTEAVRQFRRREAEQLLREAARIAKGINPQLTVTHCSLPADNNYYMHHERGYEGWEAIAATPEYDVFSTSIIIDYQTPIGAHRKIADRTVSAAKAYGKVPQRWVMSYFQSPDDLNMIRDVVQCYADAGVESIFSWTYRAGQGTFLSAPDPEAVWKVLGQAYSQVLEGCNTSTDPHQQFEIGASTL